MMFNLLLVLVPAFVRFMAATKTSINPVTDSHFLFIWADAVYLVFVLIWLYRQKIAVSFWHLLYAIIFLGSVVWDYQAGLLGLKVTLPLYLFIAQNREKISRTTAHSLIGMVIPAVLYPVLVLKTIVDNIKKTANNKIKIIPAVFWPAAIGLVAGVMILVIITSLDPEFAVFLTRDNRVWEMARNLFLSIIYYAVIFGWYFYTPIKMSWQPMERNHALRTLLQWALGTTVAVVIGYSLYDAYVLGRAFHLIKLVFESMGKNTQLYFLELVFLGGFILFLVSYLLEKIELAKKDGSQVLKAQLGLLASLVMLLPPVYNILRALLQVYIPEFGLTILRLFGIYTAFSFILTCGVASLLVLSKKGCHFTISFLVFFGSLYFLSFAVPNNIIIFNWHFDHYLQGKEVDAVYMGKVRLEKWGEVFTGKLDENKPMDLVWLWYIKEETKDKSRDYRKMVGDEALKSLATFGQLMAAQDYSRASHYFNQKTVYSEKKIEGLEITSAEHDTYDWDKWVKSLKWNHFDFLPKGLIMEYKYQANNNSNIALPVDNRSQSQSAKITFELSLPYQRDAQILNVNSIYNIKPFFTVETEKHTLRETVVGDFCSRMAANMNRYDGSVPSCCKNHLDRIPQDLSASNYSAVVEAYFQLSAFCSDPLNYISWPAASE